MTRHGPATKLPDEQAKPGTDTMRRLRCFKAMTTPDRMWTRLAPLLGLLLCACSEKADQQAHSGTSVAAPPAEIAAPADLQIAAQPLSAAPAPAAPTIVESTDAASNTRCEPGQVCKEADTGLPLRVLPRPFSSLYATPEAGAQVIESDVAAFKPWYVYSMQRGPGGDLTWYQVGRSSQATADGWMNADDVMPWRQAIIVAYAHPGQGAQRRGRVLMFREQLGLQSLLLDPERISAAQSMYAKVDQGQAVPELISIEPGSYLNIDQDFYLLPVIQHTQGEVDSNPVRLLQIAAAVPGERGQTTLEQRSASRTEPAMTPSQTAPPGVDVVFVMDMSTSMQPYLDATKRAMDQAARQFGQSADAVDIRFGLVGFRDDPSRSPGLDFAVRNFTPQLVDAAGFSSLLDNEAQAASVSSLGYSEDLFAGVLEGVSGAHWRHDSLRFVILVGDASGHPAGHAQNSTGHNEDSLLNRAEDRKVHIVSVHLINPEAAQDHARAQRQYRKLAQLRGAPDQAAYIDIPVDQTDAFQSLADGVVAEYRKALSQARSGVAPGSGASSPASSPQTAADQARQAARDTFAAALVEYLGKGTQPPRDITAWVTDVDVIDPDYPALRVHVLLTRNQLSDLHQGLKRILQRIIDEETTGTTFFESIQSLSSTAAKTPEHLASAQRVKDLGILPRYIASLPYHSDFLSLTPQQYVAMGATGRADLIASLKAKLANYEDYSENVDGWRKLNESDDRSEEVYALDLDELP